MTKGKEESAEIGREPARWPRAFALLLWITLLGFIFANVEIQTEGPAGWAANLPTWRIDSNPFVRIVWGGKPMTGYHLWLFTFMALAFHLPIFINGTFSIKLEARIFGSIMLFWIIEDFLWFVLNPSFGLARFRPEFAPWHRYWILFLPSDYAVFVLIGGALIWYSFAGGKSGACKMEPRRRTT